MTDDGSTDWSWGRNKINRSRRLVTPEMQEERKCEGGDPSFEFP